MIQLTRIAQGDFDTTNAIRIIAEQLIQLARAVKDLQAQVDAANPKKPTPKGELKEQ